MRKMTLCILLSTGILQFPGTSAAQSDALELPSSPSVVPSVTTTGEAKVNVAPDQALFWLGVETSNSDLLKARGQNEGRVRHVLEILKSYNIPDSDIQTDFLSISPQYDWPTHSVKTYIARQRLLVTIKKLDQISDLITACIPAGANSIEGPEFRTSELRRHRDEARKAAVKAAQEKAMLLARELGKEAGEPISIKEVDDWTTGGYRWWWGRQSQSMSQNMTMNAPDQGQGSQEQMLPPGKIGVSAKVLVSFKLR